MSRILFHLFLLHLFGLNAISMHTIEFPVDDSDEDFLYGNLVTLNTTDASSIEDPAINKYCIEAANVSCETLADNYCETIQLQKYPNNHIKSLLQRSPVKPTMHQRAMMGAQENGCIYTSEMRYPVIALSTAGEWRFIINVAEFLQPIRMEKCVQQLSKCLDNDLTVNSGSITYCKQEYKLVQLYSLNDNGDLSQFEYKFPANCRCRA